MQITVKLFVSILSFTAQISRSFSVLNLSKLIVLNWRVLETYMQTPPHLYICLQKDAPKLYWSILMLLISSAFKWCSVRHMICDVLWDNEINRSSTLLEIPWMFWWYIINLLMMWSLKILLGKWLWFLTNILLLCVLFWAILLAFRFAIKNQWI